MLRIWELHVDADPHLCVQAPDLRYFKDKFDGRPMKNGWAAPPYEILGRSKEVADFTSWQIGSTFLVSSKAREVLEGVSGRDIEFLPFDRIKGCELFAVNVLRVEDYMDEEKTEFVPGAGIPEKVAWKTELPPELPPVFKVPESPWTYVSAGFAEKAAEYALTGVSLADPSKARLRQIIRREQINEYPGLGLSRLSRR
jgi:hypothetical protein